MTVRRAAARRESRSAGPWTAGFALAALPVLAWPAFAVIAFIAAASSGAADPREPGQRVGLVAVGLHTLYPALLWAAWRAVRHLRMRGRPLAAATALLALPALSAASLWAWYALG